MKKKEYLKKVAEKVDPDKTYPLTEAVKLCKEFAVKKMDETILVCFNLKLKTNDRVRGTVAFPHGFGAEKKVLVFAKGDKAQEAEQAGAAHVGDDDLIAKVKGGWFDFDVAIATPDMMKDVGKLGAVLGRRGLMPNPKIGTVTTNIGETVRSFKAGKREFRSEKNGVLQVPFGKKSQEEGHLVENVRMIADIVRKMRPSDTKGEFVKSVYIHSCMGPGLRINAKELE
jgi:large subunit ribosomal protein L1